MNLRLALSLALFAAPIAAYAEQPVEPAQAAAAHTLFPGRLDFPLPSGAHVPADCAYPATLTGASGFDLACVVTDDEEFGMTLIGWLGEHGWHAGNSIIGGFEAVRETENGCEQTLSIYPHDAEPTHGVWFTLAQAPQCPAGAQ